MIAFACAQCASKFKVKDEFAGRTSKCPTCKQLVTVPDPAAERPVPKDQIEGTASSVHEAGIDAGVTLHPGASRAAGKSVTEVLSSNPKPTSRYVLEGEIARGGMGAVLRGIDRDIRREVAIKFMLDDQDAKKKARFVEEAQITGQLEHPNIVPVHELGLDARKRLFFTMKMVRGRSLEQILKSIGESGEPGASAPGESHANTPSPNFTLGRLLNVFVGICNGLSFAHSRNVIHRDLKPANVMIGDYGEVYVMDWGLAKVLGERSPARETSKDTIAFKPAAPTSSGSMVSTNRTHDGDLTQDGAIMGTPAYMPPEQALGDIEHIDQGSDIYSLGAILYAILTLQAPIERGHPTDMLLRVVDGAIKRPEVRAPERAIPPELSAIAMKALSKDRANRYPSVEAMRRDVELFLEGRSVSAKHDSAREQLVKFIKRNKGLSAGSGLALIVLLGSMGFLFSAYRETSKAYAAYEGAQTKKEEAVRRSVPALVRAGRQLANENDIDQAEEQVKLALDYDANHPEARLLKGQILVARKQWPAARPELEAYLRLRSEDKEPRAVLNAITQGEVNDGPALLAVIEALQRQRLPGLAAPLLPDIEKILADKKRLLPVYQKQIESRWTGRGALLTLEKDGLFRLNFNGQRQISDLDFLQGLPINNLTLNDCVRITDLAPLKRMPLRRLELRDCTGIKDFSPLQGLPLEKLFLSRCPQFSDLTPLKGMTKLTELGLEATNVVDLSPMYGLPLTDLNLEQCYRLNGDLRPLHGMPLKKLSLLFYEANRISDSGPLASLKELTELSLQGTLVEDLTPLQGLPLKKLNIWQGGYDGAKYKSLAPLKGMELIELNWRPALVSEADREIIRDLKSLQTIRSGNLSPPYTPTEFWRRYDAGEFRK